MSNYYEYNCTRLFVIGENVLRQMKRIAAGNGKRYLFVTYCGPITNDVVAQIKESFDKPISETEFPHDNRHGIRIGLNTDLPKPDLDKIPYELKFLDYEGRQSSKKYALELVREIKEFNADCVFAVGGGKCLDMVRSATVYLDMLERPNVILVPTSCPAAAMSTAMGMEYDDEGGFAIGSHAMLHYPEAVIIDSAIMVKQPLRYFSAGVADGISSPLEIKHTLEYINEDKTHVIAMTQAEAAINIFLQDTKAAYDAMKRGEITPEFENVLACICHLPGALAASNTVYLSHVVEDMLNHIPESHKYLHGERVSFGVLCDYVAAGKDDEMLKILDVFHYINLPVMLDDFDLGDVSREALLKAVGEATSLLFFCKRIFTPDEIVDIIYKTDKLVKAHLGV